METTVLQNMDQIKLQLLENDANNFWKMMPTSKPRT